MVALCPPATTGTAGLIVIAGIAFTVTATVALDTVPYELVPLTVYVVLVVGLATTMAPLVLLKPVEGDHEYVLTPPAVKVTLLPAQKVAVVGLTVTTGDNTVKVPEELKVMIVFSPDIVTTPVVV